MRTAQALGIKCVAVFSEADRNSMHVKMVSPILCCLNLNVRLTQSYNRQTKRISLGLLPRASRTSAPTRFWKSVASVERRYVLPGRSQIRTNRRG
jgi:hypothetical protein